VTDDTFETYVGWCRGCGYEVRVDAEDRRRCTECGLDAAPVVEKARRLRERPHASHLLAWSMIALGAAMWMQALVVAVFAARYALMMVQIRITRSDPVVDGPWIVTVSMVGAYRLEELVRPWLTIIALAGAGLGLYVARSVDRRMVIGLAIALVVTALASANAMQWMLVGDPVDARWLDSGLARIVEQGVADILTRAVPFLLIIVCGVMLVRRWPAAFPRRLTLVVVLAIVAIVDDLYRNVVIAIVELDELPPGRRDALISPALIEIVEKIWLSRTTEMALSLLPMVATTFVCALLGGKLCASGRSIATLVDHRAAPASAARHRQRERSNAVRWIISVAASSLIVSALLTPAVIKAGVEAHAPLREWPAATPMVGIPFLLALIGGAVRGSGRFALMLIAVAIGAAVIGGGIAVIVWR